MANKTQDAPTDARPLDALLALALQQRARLDASDGIQRNLGEEAVLLRGFGYKNPEIAAILGSTPASIAELVSRQQRPKKGKKNVQRKTKRGAAH